jgi:hypothetical protein
VTKLYSDPNNNNNNQWVKTKEYSYLETISISKFETDIQSAGYEVSKLNDVLAELKTCESKLKAINSKLDEIISSSQQNTGATNALNKTYEKTQKEEKTVCDGYTNVGEANWAYKCINNTGDYNGCALRNNKPYSKGNIVGPYKFDCNTDPSKYSLSEKWIKQHCCK